MREPISELTTNRLSLYLRFLNELKSKGVMTVSSKVLAEQFGLNAALIRKDLAHFGDLGVRGVGYVVEEVIIHAGCRRPRDRSGRSRRPPRHE